MKSENRLKKRKQFNWIFKNGKTVHSKNLVLVYSSSKIKGFKVGFSVTKKIGKAVVRNKNRRRMKEAVRSFENNIQSKNVLIFVAKPDIVNQTYQQIVSEVLFLLKKANLYKENEENF